MSKKDKNIQITEEEKMVNGQLVTELTAKKSKLGQVIACPNLLFLAVNSVTN